MMKKGANFIDRGRIEKMAAGGLKAEEISQRLNIHKDVVEKLMPKPKDETKAK